MQDYEPVSYNYSFFHFIFSLASMYIAMLMTGAAWLPALVSSLAHRLAPDRTLPPSPPSIA